MVDATPVSGCYYISPFTEEKVFLPVQGTFSLLNTSSFLVEVLAHSPRCIVCDAMNEFLVSCVIHMYSSIGIVIPQHRICPVRF